MHEHMGLFRGKLKVSGEWALGNLRVTKSGAAIITPDDTPIGNYGQVDPSTVGECTGLKDKNGKLIFEGDIIKTHYANAPKADFVERVVFHGGRFCGMYERGKMKMWSTLADGIKHLPQDKSVYMEWCEVIGNIHDNPELLEVSK